MGRTGTEVVYGGGQAFFLGPVIEMTGSRFSGPGLPRYEGGLSIENGDTVLFGQIHKLGTARHLTLVPFGDVNIDTVNIRTDDTADLLALD